MELLKGVNCTIWEQETGCALLDFEADGIATFLWLAGFKINLWSAEKEVHCDHTLLKQNIEL